MPLTLAHVLDRIETVELPPARRRELRSAVRSFADWCGVAPADLPATAPELRRRFAEFHPEQLGVSPGRVANVKSLTKKAIALAEETKQPKRQRTPLTPAWQHLYDQLPAKYAKDALAPHFRWCGERGIVPEQVDEAVSAAYLAHLEATATRGTPRVTHQTVVRVWNRALDTVPGWPDIRLMKPSYRQDAALPWSAFPASLEEEARTYAATLAGDDLLDEPGPAKGLKPHTIKLKLGILRRVATALVRCKHPPEAIDGLAYLVVPAHARTALVHLRAKAAKEPRALSKVADTLVGLARHQLQRPEAEVRALQRMAAKLRQGEGPKGMSPKTRERLRQFDQHHNRAAIYLWPERVVAEVERLARPKRTDALRLQTAVAVEILLHAPMRIANLAGLRLGLHVDPGRRRHDPARIVIEAAEVKNAQRLEYELPPEAAELVRLYLRKYRPMLVAHPGDALFPKLEGGTKRSDDLGRRIGKALWSELGVRVNPHLFRGLAAKLQLGQHPGTYETVARVLGHTTPDTAYLFYAGGEETRAAVAQFDRDVLALKNEARIAPVRRKRPAPVVRRRRHG
jgi:integrase